MIAPEGYLVSNLRGLAGWLAAMCTPMRSLVFDADPAAVLDYGDLSLLSAADKQALIEQLEINPKTRRDTPYWRQSSAYVPLVEADMHAFVTDWLERLCHGVPVSAGQNILADVLLGALCHITADTRWEQALLGLVRQPALGQGIRSMALRALLKHRSESVVLVDLLEAIHQGTLADSEGRVSAVWPTMLTLITR